MNLIYLDNNATTPIDPRVLEAMLPFLQECYGNAASRSHRLGWVAEEAVEKAREQAGAVIAASAKEIVWTSGATESNNLAIKGVASLYSQKGRHIITQVTEHPAVLDPCKHLQDQGYEVTYLPVDQYGVIELDHLRDAIRPDTILVSIMAANNEIGTLQPITAIGALCKEREVLFHTDATQGFCKIALDVDEMGIDLLSASGHKCHGPKGVGMLYVRRRNPRVRLGALLHGGGHEHGMRSGTLNVPGIVGFGAAAECGLNEMDEHVTRLSGLRDRLWSQTSEHLTDVELNGHPSQRLCNTDNICFRHVDAESLMTSLKDVAVSTASACGSSKNRPSYVLKALGKGEDIAKSSIRFSLGRFNTEEEIDITAEQVIAAVQRLREVSPLHQAAEQDRGMPKNPTQPTA